VSHAQPVATSSKSIPPSCRTFIILRLLALIAVSAATPNFARAQEKGPDLTRDAESQLDSLASRVSDKIIKSKRDNRPTKILVFDFIRSSPDKSSLLGVVLADRFVGMLRRYGKGTEVLDRELLKDYLEKTRTNVEDLRVNSVYLQIAEDLGATDVIRGYISEDKGQELKISIQRVSRDPQFYETSKFLLSDDLERMLVKPAPSNYRDPASIPAEAGVLLLGSRQIEGADSPHCISCPDPTFTKAARKAKFKDGTVLISAVNTTDGEVTSVYVLKGLPFGLNEQAVTKAMDWKLKPAMKDGKPVAVRVDIEFRFQLL
jgi:TonB family protein